MHILLYLHIIHYLVVAFSELICDGHCSYYANDIAYWLTFNMQMIFVY